jgi:hypothetical protein
MEPRQLDFTNFNDVLAEVDRLHRGGYDKLGQWDLAQICDHLTYFMEAGLDGAKFRVPWLIKILFGRFFLRRILKTRRMKAGIRTPQDPVPAPGGDEAAAVERLRRVIERTQQHTGEFVPSPFFGRLTRQQATDLSLIHCAHHLGYLRPK